MRTNKIFATLFFLFLIITGVLTFLTCWSNETKSLIIQFAGVIVTGIGFIIAIYQLRLTSEQYFSDLTNKKKDFLDLELQTCSNDEYHSIKTQVINKSGENKKIDYSFLLITNQDANIIDSTNLVVQTENLGIEINYTNDFNRLKDKVENQLFLNNSIGIIPLKFYYQENIAIGNENPSYTYTFDNSTIRLKKGIYSVRFFIYPEKGYHRSSVGSLIIK